MLSKHKQIRQKRRKVWLRLLKAKNINKNFNRPKNYYDLKKYITRKRKILTRLNKHLGRSNHEKLEEPNRDIIHLDSHIDFEENIDTIVNLTKKVNKHIAKYVRFNFSVDHKKIESISVAGLLYLVSQISKITEAKFHDGAHHVIFNPEYGLKNDMRIRHLFDQIGYWRYFGIFKPPYAIDKSIEENYFLSIRTSTESEFNLLNDIKKFINNNVDILKSDYKIEYQFDDAIKEAMGNSLEHAYPNDFHEAGKIKDTWWICGHYDKINQAIELVFYDYGIGIRKSMNYNLGEDANIALFDRIKDASIFKSDADLIEMAINEGLSKYKNYLDHDRGKGFKRFKNFAKVSGFDCELTIVSNSGKYKMSYNASKDTEQVEKSKLSGDIDGMLITWKINLKMGA